jgi:glutathione S-transferase
MAELVIAKKATVAATALLALRAVVVMWIQGGNRFKTGYRPPEDAALGPANGKSQGFGLQQRSEKEQDEKKLKYYQELETRWARIVQNDLENIPIGLLVAWGSLQAPPANPTLHAALVMGFVVGRFGHTWAYAKAKQPHRTLFWAAGVLSMLGMAANGVWGAFSQ